MSSFLRQLLALSNPSDQQEDWFFASARARILVLAPRPEDRRGGGDRARPPQGQFFERSV